MAEPRTPRSVRLTPAAITAIQQVADREGVTWNEAARRLLKWAIQGDHPKPRNWH